MNALDLHLLGRRLMKLGEEAMRGPGAPDVPSGLRLIVTDVAEHPGSSIGEIAERTGLSQSHVSQTVARLRDRGAVRTAGDPADGRRTLVRLAPRVAHRAAEVGAIPADAALGEAMGVSDPRDLGELVAGLEAVLTRLREARQGPGAARRRLDAAREAWPLDEEAP